MSGSGSSLNRSGEAATGEIAIFSLYNRAAEFVEGASHFGEHHVLYYEPNLRVGRVNLPGRCGLCICGGIHGYLFASCVDG